MSADTTGQRITPANALLGVIVAATLIVALVLGVKHRTLGRGTVVIDDRLTVAVDVAATPETREKGLSDRPVIGPGEGMVFLFPAAELYAFWMKDMHFPIDILWISEGQLVDMTTDVPPAVPGQEIPRYAPKFPADTVLEVQAGFAERHRLAPGMKVSVRIDR
jgi:hypothetical protein